MGPSNALSSGNIIDSVSMLFGSKPLPPSRHAMERQLDMKRRLAQLNSAEDQPDDLQQDPEFALLPEPAAKPARSKFILVIVALAAAAGWTALISWSAEQARSSSPAAQTIASKPAISAERQR